MRQYLADKIRNIALAGHGSCGKTSLAEAILFRAGVTDRLGKTENGTTVCDFDPEETKRSVSVSTAIAPVEWNNTKINLIDTPGAFDFATGMYEGIRAAGSVVIVVSARSGVTVGTEKAYKLAREQNKQVMFFINKMDSEHADFYKVLGQLRTTFGPQVCPMIVPYTEGKGIECFIDLVANKAFVHDNGNRRQGSMPNVGGFVEECRNIISEAVAESDENLMEKFFGGGTFTTEEMIFGINEGLRQGKIFPVVCGSALTLEGIDALLDAIVNHMPSAKNAGNEIGLTADGEEVECQCDILEPLAAYVFKTVADPFIGKLSYVKVISGKLSNEIAPINARTGNPERMGKIIYVTGKKQEDVSAVAAGDICAVAKLSETLTGDTLCDPRRVVTMREIGYPLATLTMAIKAKKKGEEGKVAQGILRLIEEDPVVTFVHDAESRQQLLSGLG
ncbi:MAG: elongation factor, partial [Oscillospiraceae bacterium]|nr:elongation factor [Oscillospiraceae bacterium]